ncbi:MAG TPA: amino acid adenylation domain-containing protein, partial [Thermoanaerobaculia bacterium]|nr:amino acid adenylation domain-containing protein [Thermoanaerobaculia bacterium]
MTDPSSLSHLSREERALLFERLREKKKRTGVPDGRIPRRAPDLDPVPLSFAQERLWLLDRLMPGTVAYNVVLALSIEGTLVPAALGGALRELMRRHETLRTTYGERQGRGVQIIAPPASVASRRELRMVDLGALPAAAREAEAWRLAAGEAARPFDLQHGPLLRATLLRLGETSHMLLLEVHHIATDGWSMGVMTREIPALYTAASAGRPSPLPEPALQYADFGVWQRQWLSGEVLERQLAYWRSRLAGLPALQLPTDRPRPAEPSFRGATVRSSFGTGRTRAAVRALAREHEASLFMILLAAFQALLERHTGQRDFAVGTPIANRNRAETEGVVGCFVNSLVLRGNLGGDPRFSDLAGQARKTALEAFAHQDLPFDRLVEALRPERRLAHNPLYQVSIGVQNAPVERVKLPGLVLETLESHAPASRFDLELSFWEDIDDDRLMIQVNYSTDLFDASTVRRMTGHLEVLLAGVLEDPSRRLSSLPLLTGHETHQVLREWNDTAAALPEATLVDLFREQAARRPGAAAVSSAAEGELSYADLDARSERLARRLAALGVGPDLPVALVADRTHAMVVGVLAILKAGGAYMPLDPTYPAERLSWMLADSGALILLGEPALLETLPAGVWAPVVVELTADPEETDPDTIPVGPLADALAYVMYTSGSTGQPKGVGVTHRNVVRLVRESGFADLGPEQAFLQLAPISFDAATLEIWAPLANGGRLALPPSGPLSLDEIGHAIESRGVTSLWLTAGLFHQMVEHRLEALRPLSQLLAGGDVLSPAHVERTLDGLPGLTLINGYGPTEGTTFTTCQPMTAASAPAAGVSVPIGRPIGNTRVLLLDEALRPVPMGVYGELYAAGGGVARGYTGRPDLTAERFVPNPLGQPGERMYRTGDLARFLPAGVVEFLGRRDGQVKLRGYRLELGEVEAVLARHPEVSEAAVALREDVERPGDRRLVAYVVPRIAAPPEDGGDGAVELDTALSATLRRFLGEELPEYMVPSAFVAMAALPLSPNGKVDRAALPALPDTLAAGHGGDGAKRYVAPRTPVEVRIAGLYAEVLRLERVGLHDDFFEVGGHSLLATQVVSRLRDTLGVELPLYRMFESPTVAGLARLVEDELSLLAAGAAAEVAPPIAPVPRDAGNSDLPLSFAQERLWVIDRLIPGSAAYNIALALSIEGALEP